MCNKRHAKTNSAQFPAKTLYRISRTRHGAIIINIRVEKFVYNTYYTYVCTYESVEIFSRFVRFKTGQPEMCKMSGCNESVRPRDDQWCEKSPECIRFKIWSTRRKLRTKGDWFEFIYGYVHTYICIRLHTRRFRMCPFDSSSVQLHWIDGAPLATFK